MSDLVERLLLFGAHRDPPEQRLRREQVCIDALYRITTLESELAAAKAREERLRAFMKMAVKKATSDDDILARLHRLFIARPEDFYTGTVMLDMIDARDEIIRLRDDLAIWKGEAASRSQGMVELNLDRAAMGVENMKLREALRPFSECCEYIAEDESDRRIAEIAEDGAGVWRACSGCQESEDGYVSYKDYPHDPVFQCQPGSGCRECGGIGVIWDDTDYDAYARAALAETGGDV